MKRMIMFSAVILLFIADIQAQNSTLTITGKVEDTHSEALQSATLLLLHPTDSSYIAGTITNPDGLFHFKNIPSGNYLLETSMPGFKKKLLEIKDTLKNILKSLPTDSFYQVHRSYIVNLEQVQSIEGNQLVIGMHKIPVSRNQQEEIFQVILNNRVI